MASVVEPDLPVPESLLPYLDGEIKDYSSIQDQLYNFNITFAVLVAIAISLRMFVRFRMIRAAGLDDALLTMAVLSSYGLTAACLAGAHYGLGNHIWNLDPDILKIPDVASRLTKILFSCYITYATAITFTKCSIIATYIRLFPHEHVRKISFATGFVVIAFWICHIFAICFACIPIQALWDWTIPNPKCFPLVNFFYVAAAFNIATDVVLCVLPLPTLWSLRMPRPQRIVVCVLFSIGLFACIASILRLTKLHSLTGVDISYETVSSLNWSVAEVGTAIVCVCIGAMRPLASKILPSFFKHLTQRTETSRNTSEPAKTSRSHSDHHSLASRHGSEDEFEMSRSFPDQSWPLP